MDYRIKWSNIDINTIGDICDINWTMESLNMDRSCVIFLKNIPKQIYIDIN